MHSHEWNTYVQVCKETELYSTFKNNWRFLKQVLRWTRNTWRSDFRSLITERHIWHKHPYVAFTMIDKIFNPLALVAGPLLVLKFAISQEHHPTHEPLPGWNIAASYVVWLLVTRFLKLLPHFIKRPQDIWVLPCWLVFNYYFAIMKLYALLTLHEVGWATWNLNAAAAHDEQSTANEKKDHQQKGQHEIKIEMDTLNHYTH